MKTHTLTVTLLLLVCCAHTFAQRKGTLPSPRPDTSPDVTFKLPPRFPPLAAYSCATPKSGRADAYRLVRREPTLGQKAEGYPKPKYGIVIGAAEMVPASAVRFGNVRYTVGVGQDGMIRYISTHDPRFSTPEGVTVGSTLGEVLKVAGSELGEEAGWAYYVPLRSGWNAAFTVLGDDGLQATATVCWLFRRG